MNHTEAFRNMAIMLIRSKQRLGVLAADYDITGVQATLLLSLEPGQPHKMSELADMFGCDASNITGLTDRLEEVGFMSRNQDPNDRRIRLIALTESGIELRKKLLHEMANSDAIGLGVLNQKERETMYQLLAKLV
jgi:MarR family transcriptional regulator, organic hydroperoxide resistance regulator